MPEISVDETVFLNNQKVAKLVEQMLKNPESRKRVLEAQKIVQPDAVIPEVDAVKPVNDALDAMRKEMADTVKAIKDRDDEREKNERKAKLEREWNDGRTALMKQGYNEEGLKKIEELMQAKGIVNHEDGAIIFERLNPPAEPITPSSHGPAYSFYDMNAENADDLKKLLETKGEDSGVLNKLINAGLAEVRGR